jgi:hypothetical protein
MGRWEFHGASGVRVVVSSNDNVLDDPELHRKLELSLRGATDVYSAEAPVMVMFNGTHDVGHGEANESLDQIPLVVSVAMASRSATA